MTRITAEHLSREAWVYVRQSTPDQVRHNRESRGRQYGLEDRARELGWREVVVVDDDLGQSGGGIRRPGYDRLLAAVCLPPPFRKCLWMAGVKMSSSSMASSSNLH